MAKMKIKTKAQDLLDKALEERKKKPSSTPGLKINHRIPKKKEDK